MKENKLKEIIEFAVERGWSNPFPSGSTKLFVERTLFSHPFAKAVFGNGHIWYYLCGHDIEEFEEGDDSWAKAGNCRRCMKDNAGGASIAHYAWKYHLQAAVISEDVIEYYYDYIKNNENV